MTTLGERPKTVREKMGEELRGIDPTPDARTQRWYEHPETFFHEVLGAQVYDRQLEIMEAVKSSRRVAVKGANNTGKDWLNGRLVLWWQMVHRPAKTVIIGPGHRQVRDIVWRELRQAYADARVELPGGEPLKDPHWEIDASNYATGFAVRDETAIQGYHPPGLLVIITEAQGVPQSHIERAKFLQANCLLLTGNPFSGTGEFYEAFHTKQHLYTAISISAFDSPNVREGREVIPGLVGPQEVEDLRQDYGDESAWYRSAVLGEFVDLEGRVVVPMDHVRRCRRQDGGDPPTGPETPVELGVDVGAGGDESVIRERRGVVLDRVWRTQTKDNTELEGLINRAIAATGATSVKIDEGGPGWAVAGHLVEQYEDDPEVKIMRVNFGWKSSDPDRFPKLRDELWYLGRELCEERRWDLSEVDDATISQLVAPEWSLDSQGRFKVESKDETRKRLGRSPDDADALLLAFYQPRPKGHVRAETVKGLY